MARTIRHKSPAVTVGLREKVQTRSEIIGRERCKDEAAEAGYSLSEHYRVPPTKWDDLRVAAAREGRWYR
jgi:hypothetical protein